MIRATNPTFIKDKDYDLKVDQKRSRQEKCIKDADLGHLAKPFDEYMIQFFKFHYELRKEGGIKRKGETKKELLNFQKKFFQKHSYLSPKTQDKREKTKKENIEKFEKQIDSIYGILEQAETRQEAKEKRDNVKKTNFQEK